MADEMNTDERAAIIRAAVAAMPHTNPMVADDLLGGFTMHTEVDDIVAIYQAASAQGFRDGVASLSAAEPAVAVPSVGWPDWCPEAFSALVMLDRMDVGPDDDARVDAVSAIVCSMAEKLRPSTAPALTQGAASPEGAVYAEMPQLCVLHRDLHTGDLITGYDEDDLRDFADRTHAIRIASHGQAPDQPAAVHCKGRNCAAVDGRGHSAECFSDHDRTISGLDTPGNHHPTARYVGYRGEPCNPAFTKDEQAAWREGAAARITPSPQAAQQAPAGAQSEDVQRARLIAAIAQRWIGDRTHLGALIYLDDLAWALKILSAAPAAPSTPEAGGWMPIETAPNDGRALLVWPPTWPSRSCSVAVYNEDQYAKTPRPYWERDDALGKVMYSRGKPPLLWQPLPASPTIEGESK
uniref:DUF551 domain-containing protein n=1 Tax=viral metagenome TaxID=1070528 RepID=A0A6M3M075_9ZZZZ